MLQGELWYVDLNPVKGSEQAGFRPVVILSGNLANKYLQTLICCPLTSKIKNYKGNIVLTPNKINGLTEDSEILTHQIRSFSKEQMVKKIGNVSNVEIEELKVCLNEILKY
jgi:mRNA interferase MazF